MRRLVAVLALVLVAGCGGGAKSPAAPALPVTPTPEPAPASLHPVSGLVFYDENGSGLPDGDEHTWLEGVAVTLGGRTAATGGDGAFTVLDVPAGMRLPEITARTLPPLFRAITSPIGAQGAAAAFAEVQRPRQVGRRSARPSAAR